MTNLPNINIETAEDAEKLAQEIERYDAALKLMKDKLKAFVKLNGPVKANGKVWDNMKSSSWHFEPDNLKALAGMMAFEGINPFEYLTLSAAALRKLKWSEEVISHYGVKKPGSESFRSVKEENYNQ